MPAPEMPPGVGDVGERIVNNFRRASAIYYIKSQRIIAVGEDFIDVRKALAGLEEKVMRDNRVTLPR